MRQVKELGFIIPYQETPGLPGVFSTQQKLNIVGCVTAPSISFF